MFSEQMTETVCRLELVLAQRARRVLDDHAGHALPDRASAELTGILLALRTAQVAETLSMIVEKLAQVNAAHEELVANAK